MKDSRMTAGSFATAMSPLAGIAVLLAGTIPAWGADVPFTEHVISTTALQAIWVFATDVDGDGDIDVFSASLNEDKIAWYENDGGSPPTFTERVISATANGVISVFATDVDGDGDTDVLSASLFDDKIAWYENNGGSPPTFTERVISTTADGARSVFATDVDGDGDTDVLSASVIDDKIAWYENTTPLDSDGDGVNDADDACPDSDLSPTIVIDGIDTGVENELLADGCTLADLIDAIVTDDPASVDVVEFLVALKAEGFITGQNLGAILKELNSP